MAFTNSSLVTYKNLTKKKTNGRAGHSIDTITIHCFVGQVTAQRGCDYFATTDRDCSSNYVVGYDGSIGLSVEEKNRSWCTGGDKTVNGTTGSQNDYHAVTIEVACESKSPYEVTDAAYNALIKLVADIAKRNGIKKLIWKNDKNLVGKPAEQNMTIHKWFANKSCPGPYLEARLGDIAAQANKIMGVDEKPATDAPAAPQSAFKAGDLVKITGSTYYSGKAIPAWVKKQNWYIKEVKGDRAVIDKNEKGTNSICSPINTNSIALVNAPSAPQKPAEQPKPVEPTPTPTPTPTPAPAPSTPAKKSNEEIAKEVINGKWGVGAERKRRLEAAGYNYSAIQSIVNNLVGKPATAPKPAEKTLKIGDMVRIKNGCKVYGKNYGFSAWVYKTNLYVREINGNRIVISTVPTGPVTGAVAKSDIIY